MIEGAKVDGVMTVEAKAEDQCEDQAASRRTGYVKTRCPGCGVWLHYPGSDGADAGARTTELEKQIRYVVGDLAGVRESLGARVGSGLDALACEASGKDPDDVHAHMLESVTVAVNGDPALGPVAELADVPPFEIGLDHQRSAIVFCRSLKGIWAEPEGGADADPAEEIAED